MKKRTDPDFLPEYDFSAGVRRKYVSRLAKGSNIVVLNRDVQQIFPDSVAVNAALQAKLVAALVKEYLPHLKDADPSANAP